MSTGTVPNFSNMTRILLTGGAGYIGCSFAPRLLAASCTVTVVDNLMHRQFSLASCFADEDFRFVRGDVRDERIMGPLLAEADAIIPLAALVGAPLCDRDPIAATGINRDAVQWLWKIQRRAADHPARDERWLRCRREKCLLHGRNLRCVQSRSTAARRGRSGGHRAGAAE